MSEDFPFTSAEALLSEAADWLADMMLPKGHADRQEDDDEACLEAATNNIDKAICALSEAGVEQIETGQQIVDGYSMPLFEPRIIDPDAASAAGQVEALTKGIVTWGRGGPKQEIDEAMLAAIRTLLPQHFAGQLAGERRMREALAEACDY